MESKKQLTVKDVEDFICQVYSQKTIEDTKRNMLNSITKYLQQRYKNATIELNIKKEQFKISGSEEDKIKILEDLTEIGLVK